MSLRSQRIYSISGLVPVTVNNTGDERGRRLDQVFSFESSEFTMSCSPCDPCPADYHFTWSAVHADIFHHRRHPMLVDNSVLRNMFALPRTRGVCSSPSYEPVVVMNMRPTFRLSFT